MAEQPRKRVVLYARSGNGRNAVSGETAEQQLERCREWAAGQGWQVVAELSDGCDPAWPGVARALELAQDGRIDVVAAADMKALPWRLLVEQQLRAAGAAVVYVDVERFRTQDRELPLYGRLRHELNNSLQIALGLAEQLGERYPSDELAPIVIRAILQAAEQGNLIAELMREEAEAAVSQGARMA